MQAATNEWSWFSANYSPANPSMGFSWKEFWSDTIERSKSYEIITSMSMRGNNDTANTQAQARRSRLQALRCREQLSCTLFTDDGSVTRDHAREVGSLGNGF